MNNLLAYDLVFQHPDRLWFILPIVCISGVLFWLVRRETKNAFRENPFLRLHGGDEGVSTGMHVLKRWLMWSVISALLVSAWAEPFRRTTIEEPVYGGVRIAFLLDVSLSMVYAHDVAPFPNRLVAAKSVLGDFAAQTVKDFELRGTYMHAIIPFAASARPYLPFTRSYEEFIEAIDSIDETVINSPGTSLLAPILEYETMLKNYPPPDKDTVDIVIIVSDGGKGEGIRSELGEIRAALLRMPSSVNTFAVGVGSVIIERRLDGSEVRRSIPVPLIINDSAGGFIGYALEEKNNSKSKTLYSELDERILEEVAGDHGRYFFYEGKEQFLKKLKEIVIAKRKLVRTIPHQNFGPVAAWFLLPAVLLGFFFFGCNSRINAFLARLLRRSNKKISIEK